MVKNNKQVFVFYHILTKQKQNFINFYFLIFNKGISSGIVDVFIAFIVFLIFFILSF